MAERDFRLGQINSRGTSPGRDNSRVWENSLGDDEDGIFGKSSVDKITQTRTIGWDGAHKDIIDTKHKDGSSQQVITNTNVNDIDLVHSQSARINQQEQQDLPNWARKLNEASGYESPQGIPFFGTDELDPNGTMIPYTGTVEESIMNYKNQKYFEGSEARAKELAKNNAISDKQTADRNTLRRAEPISSSPFRNMVDLSNIETLTDGISQKEINDNTAREFNMAEVMAPYGERIGEDTYFQNSMTEAMAPYGERKGMSKKDYQDFLAEKAFNLDQNLAKTKDAAAPRGVELAESIFEQQETHTMPDGTVMPGKTHGEPLSGASDRDKDGLGGSYFKDGPTNPSEFETLGMNSSIEGQIFSAKNAAEEKENRALMLAKIAEESNNSELAATAETLLEEAVLEKMTPAQREDKRQNDMIDKIAADSDAAYLAKQTAAEVVGSEIVDENIDSFTTETTTSERETIEKVPGATEEITKLEEELKALENNPAAKNEAYKNFLRKIGFLKPYKEELWSALFSAAAGVMMGQSFTQAIANSFGRAQLTKEKEEADLKERNDNMLKSLMDNSQYMTPTTFSSLLNQYGVSGSERNYYNAIFNSQKAELASTAAAAYSTAEIGTANNALWDDIKMYGELDRTGSHGKYMQMMGAIQEKYSDMGFDVREPGWAYVVSNAMTDFWRHSDEWDESGAKDSDGRIMLPIVFFNNAMGLYDSQSESMIPISKNDKVLFAAVGQAKMIINTMYKDRNERKNIEMGIHKEWVTKFMGRGGTYSTNYPLYYKDQIMTNLKAYESK